MPTIDAKFSKFHKDLMHAMSKIIFTIHDCLFILDHLLVDVPTNYKWKFYYLRKFEAFFIVVESEGIFPQNKEYFRKH